MTQLTKLQEVVAVLQKLPDCRPVSVGGSVRDAIMHSGTKRILMGFESYCKDFDLEVFGATSAAVFNALQNAGIGLELVGRAFPVYKVRGFNIDIAFPRYENKTGEGHTDFSIVVDPSMTFEEAARRRDFRCNAIGYDWNSNTILDPWHGVDDIRDARLDPVSDKFLEDALRVLRCFKFIARLGFTPTTETLVQCARLSPTLKSYARERLRPEWDDFILHGEIENVKPAIQFLIETGTAAEVFPEIAALKGVEQNPHHHPEGDVLNHTVHCLEHFMGYVREKLADDRERLIVGYAVLTHDFGKPQCTFVEGGKIKAHGHEDTNHARKFLERLFDPADDIINQIEQLVKAHMRPVTLHNTKAGYPAIRRLNVAVNGRIDRLMAVVECDQGGRPPKLIDTTAILWVLERTKELKIDNNTVIKPIINGGHLLYHLQLKPGRHYGSILDEMFEAQLDGKFVDEESGIKHLVACYRA